MCFLFYLKIFEIFIFIFEYFLLIFSPDFSCSDCARIPRYFSKHCDVIIFYLLRFCNLYKFKNNNKNEMVAKKCCFKRLVTNFGSLLKEIKKEIDPLFFRINLKIKMLHSARSILRSCALKGHGQPQRAGIHVCRVLGAAPLTKAKVGIYQIIIILSTTGLTLFD